MSLLCCKSIMEWFKQFFWKSFFFVRLDATAVFFGFTEEHLEDRKLQNHLLLLFKIYLYKSRSYGFVSLKSLLLKIKKLIAWKGKLQMQMQISINLSYLSGIKLITSEQPITNTLILYSARDTGWVGGRWYS